MYFWIYDVQVLKRNGDNRQQYVQKQDHTIWILVCMQSALNFESLFLVLGKVPQRPCLWIKECWTSSRKRVYFCIACRYKSSRETCSCAVTSTKGFAGAKKCRVYKPDVLLPPTPFPTGLDNDERNNVITAIISGTLSTLRSYQNQIKGNC